MAKKTLKIADKPTLDEVKTLLGKSEEQIEYMHHKVTLDGTGNFQTVLEINGSGILYATACEGQSIGNRIVHFRVIIDDTVFFDKGQYVPGTGTAVPKKFGIFSKDFTPNATWGSSLRYIESTMIPGTSSFISLVLEDNYTDGSDISVTGPSTMMARFFKNPIEFYNSLKIEVSSVTSNTTTDVIYSINE